MIWIVSSMTSLRRSDVALNPYNAREFVDRWEKENGPTVLRKSFTKTESVPSWRAGRNFPKSVVCYSMRLYAVHDGYSDHARRH